MHLISLFLSNQQEDLLSSCLCGDVNELTMQSLDALNEMKIKFPGKSSSEAAELLDSVRSLMLSPVLLYFHWINLH